MGKLGQWLQVLSNLGLFAGLILVAIQINQTHSLMRAEHGSRFYEHRMNFAAAAMGENYADALAQAAIDPKTLTPPELLVLHYAFEYKVNEINRNAYLVEQGILREEMFLSGVDAGYPEFADNVVSRAWWKQRFGEDSSPDDASWEQVLAQRVKTPAGNTFSDFIQAMKNPVP